MLESLTALAQSRHLHLALRAHELVLLAQSQGWRKRPPELLVRQPLSGPADELPQQLDSALSRLSGPGQAQLRGLPLHIALDAAWVRTWTVQPPANASSIQDSVAAVQMRFQQVYDESPAGWQMRYQADVRHPYLACAVRQDWLAALLARLAAHRLTLLALQPECVALWNHWCARLPSGAWLGLCRAGELTLLATQAQRPVAVRRLPLAATATAAQLAQAVAQEAQRWQLPLPSRLGLCGAVPQAWRGPLAAGLQADFVGEHADILSLWGVA